MCLFDLTLLDLDKTVINFDVGLCIFLNVHSLSVTFAHFIYEGLNDTEFNYISAGVWVTSFVLSASEAQFSQHQFGDAEWSEGENTLFKYNFNSYLWNFYSSWIEIWSPFTPHPFFSVGSGDILSLSLSGSVGHLTSCSSTFKKM